MILSRLLRAALTVGNALAFLLVVGLLLAGRPWVAGILGALFIAGNGASWPVELWAGWKVKPVAVATSIVTLAGPPVLAWIADILDSLARKEIPPAQAKALAAAHLAVAMDEAEKESAEPVEVAE
jgi:hypothetical protein